MDVGTVKRVSVSREPIGQGATSEVYKGETSDGRVVAVKVMREGIGDALKAAFVAEKKILVEAEERWRKGNFFLWKDGELAELVAKVYRGEGEERYRCAGEALPTPQLYQNVSIEGHDWPEDSYLVLEWFGEGSNAVGVLRWFDEHRDKLSEQNKLEEVLFRFACYMGQIMLLMKAMGKYNPDMKWGDIFVVEEDEEIGRVVLLDWNGLSDLPQVGDSAEKGNISSLREGGWELVEDRVRRTLALLIYRLATQRAVSLNLEDDVVEQVEREMANTAFSKPFRVWLKEGLQQEALSFQDWITKAWLLWLVDSQRFKYRQLVRWETDLEEGPAEFKEWFELVRARLLKRKSTDPEDLWQAWQNAQSQEIREQLLRRLASFHRDFLWRQKEAVVGRLPGVKSLWNKAERFYEIWEQTVDDFALDEVYNADTFDKIMERNLQALEEAWGNLEEEVTEREGEEKIIQDFLLGRIKKPHRYAEEMRLLKAHGKGWAGFVTRADVMEAIGWLEKSQGTFRVFQGAWCRAVQNIVVSVGTKHRWSIVESAAKFLGLPLYDVERMWKRFCDVEFSRAELKRMQEDTARWRALIEAGKEEKEIPHDSEQAFAETCNIFECLTLTKYVDVLTFAN